MKLSARNILAGTVKDIKKGAVAAQVKIDIGGGKVITSTVTVDAVEELGLQVGGKVSAVIKASEVILAIE
jgi:molybdopterin-binding protein